MGTAPQVLAHLTVAAQKLNQAFDAIGDTVAAAIICRAMTLTASAIEQCIHPIADEDITAPRLLRVVADDFTPSDDWREFPTKDGSIATFEIGGGS